ncbi:MAG TPA: hypothetical protein ENJ95_19915 [Bacteroidetes bacterium]|nr:hypothetical protein [Bacteroidota bacterium]
MKNISKVTYDALKVEGLKEVFQHISRACQFLGIDFFIIGAIARNVWLVMHDENPAGTKDIDFAVYIPNIEEYTNLKNKLQTAYQYNESNENAFCMISPKGIQIDLLPFGEIENENQVMIEGKGLTAIKLDGFKEVYDFGLQEIKIGNENYTVCNIPSVVILKLIAYDDRPEHRIKDIKDINSICKYYPDLEQEHIWANHFDLYTDDRSHDEVAMIVLGREIKKIAMANDKLYSKLLTILNKAIAHESSFLDLMIEDNEKENVGMKRLLLKHILSGLKEGTET